MHYALNLAGERTLIEVRDAGGAVVQRETRDYDSLGRLAEVLSGAGVKSTYDYDGRGNIEARTFDAQTQTFTHDALDRLRSEAGAASTQAFGLDGNGNRLSDASGSYGIAPASNRLATAPYYTPDLDAAGYTRAYHDPQTGEALMAFAWNAAGDLAEVESGGRRLATYTYDHRHLRVTKTVSGQTTVFHHNDTGQLIAETRSSGEPLRSYVWLDDAPVAVIEHAALTGGPERTLYLETDLLMTPRAASDDHGRTVWTWKGDAFGATVPEEDPDGDGHLTQVHLRFPGQYFDIETGLHYNWHRYYEPWTGRYLSSDPVGLEGGVNLYAYADAAPHANMDPDGTSSIALPLRGQAGPGLASLCALNPLACAVGTAGAAGVAAGSILYPHIAEPLGDFLDAVCKNDDREKRCDHQYYAVDIPTCRGVSRNRGKAAAARCYASAAERYAACLKGHPLPPLDTWNN